ncbi:MAG: 30S ribosomal protein S6 [Chloroflexi bacterium]|nr:30S ribosomal protein S6 [Chloroflexota bacterium]
MRNYEVAFIIHPEVDDEGVGALTEKVQGWITSGGGSIEKVERQGRKKLAYEIRKQREGHYVLLYTKMNAGTPLEVERNLRLTEQIMRFMIVRLDAEPAAPVQPAPEEPAPASA